jgi:hypothetical protein
MCSLIWRMLDEQTDYLNNRHAWAKHLLWGLVIIKVYGNEKAMCAIVANPKAPSEKTYRKWAWYFVKAISSLEGYVVSIWTYIKVRFQSYLAHAPALPFLYRTCILRSKSCG